MFVADRQTQYICCCIQWHYSHPWHLHGHDYGNTYAAPISQVCLSGTEQAVPPDLHMTPTLQDFVTTAHNVHLSLWCPDLICPALIQISIDVDQAKAEKVRPPQTDTCNHHVTKS